MASNECLKSAKLLRSKGDYSIAIDLLTKLISSCGSSSNRLSNNDNSNCSKSQLAAALNERGVNKYLFVDFDGAVEDYTLALAYKKDPVYYYNRAVIHYRLGRFEQAVADADSALAMNPLYIDATLCREQAIKDGRLTL